MEPLETLELASPQVPVLALVQLEMQAKMLLVALDQALAELDLLVNNSELELMLTSQPELVQVDLPLPMLLTKPKNMDLLESVELTDSDLAELLMDHQVHQPVLVLPVMELQRDTLLDLQVPTLEPDWPMKVQAQDMLLAHREPTLVLVSQAKELPRDIQLDQAELMQVLMLAAKEPPLLMELDQLVPTLALLSLEKVLVHCMVLVTKEPEPLTKVLVPSTVLLHQEHLDHMELALKVQSEFTEAQVDQLELEDHHLHQLEPTLLVKVQATSQEVPLLLTMLPLKLQTKPMLLAQLVSELPEMLPLHSMLLAHKESMQVLALKSTLDSPLEPQTELADSTQLLHREQTLQRYIP